MKDPPFTINVRSLQRVLCTMLAALLVVVGLPLLHSGSASADQIQNREIKLSDAANSGTSITSGVGSGTNVTYRVSFTAIHQAESIVIDFCSEDPLVGDTCTTPTNMTAASAAFTGVTGQVTAGNNWTITPAAGRVKLANDGVPADDILAGTQTFDLTGITNTSTVGTFYARILIFANNTYGTYVSAASPGNYLDYGGIAMSTVRVITVTARVEEQLTFCVTKAVQTSWTTTHDCSDPVVGQVGNQPAIILGHGSPTLFLDASAVDHASLYTQTSSNALSGVAVRLHSSVACGGLSADGGTTCPIPATNAGSGAGASAITAGTAAFGLFVSASTLDTNGVGSLTPSTVYYNASHTTIPTDVWYGMDTTTANNNVNSTFGSTLTSTAAPLYRVDNTLDFAATAALTTPAGIYVGNFSAIATGTF